MFARLRKWLFGQPRFLWTRSGDATVNLPEGQSCRTCVYWEYCDPSDEPTGYCGHPFHSTDKSEHVDYGGHWAWSTDWCRMWEQATNPPSVQQVQEAYDDEMRLELGLEPRAR